MKVDDMDKKSIIAQKKRQISIEKRNITNITKDIDELIEKAHEKSTEED